jgi:hypothetical protein
MGAASDWNVSCLRARLMKNMFCFASFSSSLAVGLFLAACAVNPPSSQTSGSQGLAGEADAGCDGDLFSYCSNGQIAQFCCPPFAPCFAPAPFCDLGQGACMEGEDCPTDGGSSPNDAAPDADAGCFAYSVCIGGQIEPICCPPGAPCVAPGPFCDLGNGSCTPGTDCKAECQGPAPNCFGNDLQGCCGRDPAGPATCSNGAWMCGDAPAPGCNGDKCGSL